MKKKDIVLDIKKLNIELQTDANGIPVVKKIDLRLYLGKTLGLIGESGCGKSVTSLSILRLLDAKIWNLSGELLLKGKNLMQMSHEDMRRIRGKEMAMITQNPMISFNPLITIGKHFTETLITHTKMRQKEAAKVGIEMLQRMGLQNAHKLMDLYPFQCSGGMLQRVMIAIALSMSPAVLIADEPTTSLDVTIQHQIICQMIDLKRKYDTSILFISHDLGVIARIADEVAVMYRGYIVEKAPVEVLLKNPQHPYTQALILSKPAFQKRRLEAIKGAPPRITEKYQGCPFADRCEYAHNRCLQYDMAPKIIDPLHQVCCIQARGIEVNACIS